MAELQLDPQKTALVLIDLQNAVLGMTLRRTVPIRLSKIPRSSRTLSAPRAPQLYTCVSI